MKGHQKGHEGALLWSLKEIVNTWLVMAVVCADPFTERNKREGSSNKQMNFLIPVCVMPKFAENPQIPSD